MKILNAAEIRLWDQYTIEHEPISSINLMERAAATCVQWIKEAGLLPHSFAIFCGKGNNGGDGLAIARMLAAEHCTVEVYILEFGHKGTDDFQVNLERLHQARTDIRYIQTEKNFHEFKPGEIIIDALFGSGLNRPLEAVTAKLVEHINQSGCRIDAHSTWWPNQAERQCISRNIRIGRRCENTQERQFIDHLVGRHRQNRRAIRFIHRNREAISGAHIR